MTGEAQPIEWYLARDNKQYGPLSDVEIHKLLEFGHLKEADLIWRAGFADWTPAGAVFTQAFVPPPPETGPDIAQGASADPDADADSFGTPTDFDDAGPVAHEDAGPGRVADHDADDEAPRDGAEQDISAAADEDAFADPAAFAEQPATVDQRPLDRAAAHPITAVPAPPPAFDPGLDESREGTIETDGGLEPAFAGEPTDPPGGAHDVPAPPAEVDLPDPVDPEDPATPARPVGRVRTAEATPKRRRLRIAPADVDNAAAPAFSPGMDLRPGAERWPAQEPEPDDRGARSGEPAFSLGAPGLRAPHDGRRPAEGDAGIDASPPPDFVPAFAAPDLDEAPARRPFRATDFEPAGPAPRFDERAPRVAEGAVEADDIGEEEFYDDEETPRRRGTIAFVIGLLVLAIAIGAGSAMLYKNGTFADLMKAVDGRPSQAAQETASLSQTTSDAGRQQQGAPQAGPAGIAPPSSPAQLQPPPGPGPLQGEAGNAPQQYPDNPGEIDRLLQASPAWRVVKAEFPEWYDDRTKEAARLAAESAQGPAITKYLLDSMVDLRRRTSEYTYSASLPRLQAIARAFLDSAEALASHSDKACYSFISTGENGEGISQLYQQAKYRSPIDAQFAAVFAAAAEGRSTPTTHAVPTQKDYDQLSSELTRLGWTPTDLDTFADASKLANATPAAVCSMVRDWFRAHLTITDESLQATLLKESIRPVVGG